MLERLAGIEQRYEELDRMMADPAIMTDYTKVNEYAQERSTLTDLVDAYRKYRKQMQELDEAKALRDNEDDVQASRDIPNRDQILLNKRGPKQKVGRTEEQVSAQTYGMP